MNSSNPMHEMFLRAAEEAGATDLEKVSEVVQNAVRLQGSVIDDLVDSKMLGEEKFMEELANSLSLKFEPDMRPKNVRRLKEVCSAHVALKYRLMPLGIGDDIYNGEDETPDGVPVATEDAPASEDETEGVSPDAEEEIDDGEVKRLVIATYDPFNLVSRQAATQFIDMPIEWRMASRTRILQGIQKLYGVGADTFAAILEGRDIEDELSVDKDTAHDLDGDDQEASVVKFVNQIVREALQQRATDIHVEPLESNLRIRYRIDGKLHDVPVPDQIKSLQSMVIARLKIMSKLDIAERRLPQDGRIALEMDGQGIDVRVATIPTVEGESVSLRLLNQEKFNLEKLGMLHGIRSTMETLLKMSNGVILITGPTGSGKSTSLYSFLSELNTTEVRIVTIEDPVENKLEGVMQIAVKSEIDLTFANGLRSILRGDPNIVMVGEIRDLETAEIAIRASLTGHLVFSTLHTNDAIGGISRLIDMGVEPFLVSAAVRAFLAQRLVRRLCKSCREPFVPEESYLKEVSFPVGQEGTIYNAAEHGCDQCSHSGFHGRLAIYEIAVLTPPMQELIVKRGSEPDLHKQALAEGFLPMREYGFQKVLQGETTLEEVVSVTTVEMQMVES